MAKKIADRFRTRSRPLTLAALEQYGALAGYAPPQGEFDPGGTWKHAYRVWMVAGGGLIPKPADVHYRGLMEIERRPLPDGKAVTLAVHQSIIQHTGVHETAALITCAADALASLRRWKLVNTVCDPLMKPMPEAGVKQSGKVDQGTVTVEHGGRTATFEAPPPLTTNWSLFDAVQRMPRNTGPPAEFAMLQECDLLKPSQQITYRGTGEHTLGGNTVRLHHWQHVGEGILPYDYYADQQGRLLVAVGGLRAYILDANAPQLHKQVLNWIAERAKR